MEGNPYVNLITTLREDAMGQIPIYYRLGKVVSTDPLRIEVGGTIQEGSDLLRNNGIYIDDEVMKLKRVSDEEEIEYYPAVHPQ